jgi:hypothetical protein
MSDFEGRATADGTLTITLKTGDTITECTGVWHASDRLAEELGRCHQCDRPTFRIITITSAEKLERRAALCGRHFIIAARELPELRRMALAHTASSIRSNEVA